MMEEKAEKAYPKHEFGIYIKDNELKREGYIKALQEVSNLPKIEGWIARNKEPDELCFFPGNEPPVRMDTYWFAGFAWSYTKIQDVLPELTWEDEPLKVELIINKL